jgi:hypothetical protein
MAPRRAPEVPVKYLLTIYTDESRYATMTPDDSARLMAEYGAFGQEAQKAGVLLGGEGLQPTATATTVRVHDGEALFTDGPFAETREQLGGYYLLECGDLDEAARWAAKIPDARDGAVEVRPIMDYEAMGNEDAHTQSEGAAT